MKLLPYNSLYNGILLDETSDEILKISELFQKYADIGYKYTDKETLSIVYPYDVDDDHFGLKNAFGDKISDIANYSLDGNTFNDITLSFPALKKDYPDLYNANILYIKIKREIPYLFPLFSCPENYTLLNYKYEERFYYVLNIVCGCKLAPNKGTIDSVNNGYVVIKDDNGNYHDVYLDTNFLLVEKGDNVSYGQLLNEVVTVDFNNGFNIILKDVSKKQLISQLTYLNVRTNILI